DKSDEFYQEVYEYFKRKGFTCIILERICYLISLAFVICFSVFLFGCIDYSIINEKAQLSQVIVDQCVYRLDWKIKFLLSIFIIMWLYLLIKYISEFQRFRKIYYFYNYKLKIKDTDIQSISWEVIMEKIIKLYNEENQSEKSGDELDAMKIVNIIMRKENYFIALINEQCIKFNIPYFENKQLFTDMLKWNVQWCINNFIFDRYGHVKGCFLSKDEIQKRNMRQKLSKSLSQKFILLGIFNLILFPFLLIFSIIYSFYRYAEEIYNNPGSIMKKSYNSLARWRFREFNELPHVFEKRLNRSYENAIIYLNQSPNYKGSIIFRLVAFISGSIVVVLSILTLMDQEFFNKFEITPGGSVLFYIGVFTSILAFSKGMIIEDTIDYDSELLMEKISLETHYYPQKWKEKNYSNEVRKEFGSYFDTKIFMIFRNIYGIILTPFILIISLPNYSSRIVKFVQNFTVHLPSVGYVCSYANFDFRYHGNPD
ncbi:APG9-domain-containing protein, partial [Neocallimastix californiae]